MNDQHITSENVPLIVSSYNPGQNADSPSLVGSPQTPRTPINAQPQSRPLCQCQSGPLLTTNQFATGPRLTHIQLFQRTQIQTSRPYTPSIRPVSQIPTFFYPTNMPARKTRAPKPCPPPQAAQCDVPQTRNRYPDQHGRDIPEETMAEGRRSRYSSPPGGHRSSNLSPEQYCHRQPYVRPPQQNHDHRTYEPRPGPEGRHPDRPEQPEYSGAKRMTRNQYPDERGRDIPEETMAEGRRSRYSPPPGGHRSSYLSPEQYRHRQPYVRPPQQNHDHRTYEPRPGPEGRHPDRPEQPEYSGVKRMIRNRYPDQRGRDIPEETMAEGRRSRYSPPPGGHRSSNLSPEQYRHRQPYVSPPQQNHDHRTYEPCPGPEGRHPDRPEEPEYSGAKRMTRNRYPDQRGRDIPEEIMAEGRRSRYSPPPVGHRSSNLSPEQYHHRQPYVRPPQQNHDHRTYEPRPGPEGRHPDCPEQPEHSGAKRMTRNRYPDQRGRDIPEETMAEGRRSRYSPPPGGHRSSNLSPEQYRHRQPYVRPPQQNHDHRTYEPCPGPEGRHPDRPEEPEYSGAKRMTRNRYPDQRGRDIPEEIMAEGRRSRYSPPPVGHRSSNLSPEQYRHRQPYVRPPQQNHDHRTYEPRPGPEGRHPDRPEQPEYSGAKRMTRNRYPDQRGRDIPEETMAEGRRSRYSPPPGGHRSSNLSPEQYRHRQPYVRPPQQNHDHRTYEPRPGPEGRHPDRPEQPEYSGAKRMTRNRYPDQRGRDIPEETMAEDRRSRYSPPPGGHRSSNLSPEQLQYRHRQPYVRPPQQNHDHRTYEPRPGPEGRHPDRPEQPEYSGVKRMTRNRYPDQRGRDIPEETMAEDRRSRYSPPPGGHRSSNLSPEQLQYRHRQPYVRPPQQNHDHRTYEPRPGPEGRHPDRPEQPEYSGAKRMTRNRYPDQRGRDIPEETMAEGRRSSYSPPPGGHPSPPPTPRQNSKRPDKRTPKAVDPTTQPIEMKKKGASDTKPGPDDEPKQQPAAQRSSSPGLLPPDVQPKKSGNACKPVLKRESLPVEPESDITQDLFKKVHSILNRQTPEKFLQLVKQVKDLPIDTEERLKGVVDLLFDKAMNETSFLVIYAKMCNCLTKLTVPCADKPHNTVNFRKLLISRCHKEFDKDTVDDVVKDITRRRYIGNIKFICELYKVKMLNDFIMHDCLDKLLTNQDELALECLCIMLTTVSKDLEFDETKMEYYFNYMEEIVTERKTSSRIRYMLQDTIDLILQNLVSQKAAPRTLAALSEAAPKALNGLAEQGTELETAALQPSLMPPAELQPQASSPAEVPTPQRNQDFEARRTLESQSSSCKKGRKRRKRNNQPQKS